MKKLLHSPQSAQHLTVFLLFALLARSRKPIKAPSSFSQGTVSTVSPSLPPSRASSPLLASLETACAASSSTARPCLEGQVLPALWPHLVEYSTTSFAPPRFHRSVNPQTFAPMTASAVHIEQPESCVACTKRRV